MARLRTIKPEFFTSEQIVECSTSARLLFIGIWCFSDDGGVHPASVKRLKMEIFPGDAITDDEIQKLIDELTNAKLLVEFEAENECFWHVTGWAKHQKIDRPTIRHPQPQDTNSTSPRRGIGEHSTSPRDGAERSGVERSRAERSRVESKGAERKSPLPDFGKLDEASLKSTSQLMAWLDEWKPSVDPECRIWVLAIAERATDPDAKAGKPVAMFVKVVKDYLTTQKADVADKYHDAAKLRLRAWKSSQNGDTNGHPESIAEVLTQ